MKRFVLIFSVLFCLLFNPVTARLFFYELFKIPSASMMPTLLIGDHILVKKYAYGFKIPFTRIEWLHLAEPRRGDVVVFSNPEDEDIDFVKRIVGVPGDQIVVQAGRLLINGQAVFQKDFSIQSALIKNHCIARLSAEDENQVPFYLKPVPYYRQHRRYRHFLESADGREFYMIQHTKKSGGSDFEAQVPQGSYFVMGDNRDESIDSRKFGFVPFSHIKGRAISVLFSVNHENIKCAGVPGMRGYRVGRSL